MSKSSSRGGSVVVACLACAVLAVSAGCRSTGEAGTSPPPLDGEVSVCGLATVDQIQQTVGRQIEEFTINNDSSHRSGIFGFECQIYMVTQSGIDTFALEVSTTFPDNISTVPAASTFEDVAAAPNAEPVSTRCRGRGRSSPMTTAVLFSYGPIPTLIPSPPSKEPIPGRRRAPGCSRTSRIWRTCSP